MTKRESVSNSCHDTESVGEMFVKISHSKIPGRRGLVTACRNSTKNDILPAEEDRLDV